MLGEDHQYIPSESAD